MSRIQDERVVNPKPEIIHELRKILSASSVLDKEQEMRPYECDGLSAFQGRPMVVVLPETIEEVQEIMSLCHKESVPVVARGAGTGLSGGATPIPDGVLLSLAKFNKIIELDTENLTALVQPGVRNLAISQAATPHGMYYAPDPSSQIACSIGGNVAENAGGVHCLKYGLTVHNIIKLKLVSVEGEVFEVGSNALDSSGLDLLALMTGSEGMLAIIVEITVKLLPKPEKSKALLAAFDDVELAGNAVAEIIAAGITPAGLEMMDDLAIRAAEDFAHAGYPVGAKAILIGEVDGTAAEVDQDIDAMEDILRKGGATQIKLARNEEERQAFWKGRKSAFPAVGRISPDYYCMDGTIPRRELSNVLKKMDDMSKHYDLRVANVFHAGDGNLHPLILFDANTEGELERAEDFGSDILELCVEVGGTVSGEHGIGIEKLNQMCFQFNSAELTQMHSIKAAFDPQGTLNPGKAVPTLHRCAEFGAMHVHKGNMPFPDLPRF